ncbi:MAG: pyridoxamine 5'-phosphate oxidase family protein, partial [Chloroflexota bacterium]|nr:pyridoxamine 5'-phosphate oxidase family protein [Chloroflexota bacterium]
MSGLPAPDRPQMPPGYGVGDPQYGFEPIAWAWVEQQLQAARNYWLTVTRPGGTPHVAPVWGVWLEGALLFFTDPSSLKARSFAQDARAAVHLESGDDVVILEGRVEPERATRAALDAYEAKYGVRPEHTPGAAFRVEWTKALAWGGGGITPPAP